MSETYTEVNPSLYESEATPTAGLDSEDHKAPRYLFFAGDLIAPEIKRSSPRLAWGGDTVEHDYKTLFRTHNILYRYRITPMLPGINWINVDLCADDAPGVLSVKNFGTPGMPNLQNGFAAYPGKEITSLLMRKRVHGLIELSALRGMTPDEVRNARIQQHFFPEWDEYASGKKKMPQTTSWAKKSIQAGIDATTDPKLRSIGVEMLRAVDAFYFWGLDRIKQETTMVKAPPVAGTTFTFRYTSLAEQLFEQLEKSRDDYLRADAADLLSNLAGKANESNVPVELVNTMNEMLKQNQSLIQALLANAQGGNAATAAPAPPVVSEPEVATTAAATVSPKLDVGARLAEARRVAAEKRRLEESKQ